MRDILLHLVNMSITASWLILAIIVYRMIFKKAPKWIMTILWCLVGLRLICPFTFESRFSLIPSEKTLVMDSDSIVIDSGFTGVDSTINAYLEGVRHEAAEAASVKSGNLFAVIWIIGAAVILIYSLISYIRLRRSISDAVRYSDRVFQSEKIDSPFVLGIFRPVIYMSYGLSEEQIECVLQHENAHIKRKDHLIKPLGFILLCVYWFNPFVWIAYILLCHDIELACDERVISEIGFDKKKMYSQTLLDCSIPRRLIVACPVAFAEVGVKERVLNIMKMKKTKKGVIAVALLGIAAVGVMFMTKPFDKKEAKAKSEIVVGDSAEAEKMAAVIKASEEEAKMTAEIKASEEEAKIMALAEEEAKAKAEADKFAEANTEDVYATVVDNDDTTGNDGKVFVQVTDGNVPQDTTGEQDTTSTQGTTEAQDTSGVDNNTADDAEPVVAADENEVPSDEDTYVTVVTNYVYPVMGGAVITRAFSADHQAVDYAAPSGTPLVASIAGKVISIGYDDVNGNYIVIQGADGTTIYYNNCESVSAKKGDSVKAGDQIAILGTSGKSTGPHVHFAVADSKGNFIDPRTVIK